MVTSSRHPSHNHRLLRRLGGFFSDLKKWVSGNIPGAIFGLLFGLIINVSIWGLAYFGYIDLYLPSHFDYQTQDRLLGSKIAAGYQINRSQEISDFRAAGTKTVLVIARNKKYLSTGSDGLQYGDILYLFDQKGGRLTQSYRYQPFENVKINNKDRPFGYMALSVNVEDIDNDGDNEILVSWSHIGADSQPPVPMILKDDMGQITKITLTEWETKSTYFRESVIYDSFTGSSVIADNVDGYFTGANSLLAYYVTDLVCRACSEENKYFARTYTLYNEKLIPSQGQDFNSFSGLTDYAKKNNYQ